VEFELDIHICITELFILKVPNSVMTGITYSEDGIQIFVFECLIWRPFNIFMYSKQPLGNISAETVEEHALQFTISLL